MVGNWRPAQAELATRFRNAQNLTRNADASIARRYVALR